MAKSKKKCYTFIRTIHDWNETFEQGVKYFLSSKQSITYDKYITETENYIKQYKKQPTPCGCK